MQRLAGTVIVVLSDLFLQDFYNLVDVYLDAVFFPNCVRDPRTFAQEGWHYELEQPEVPNASLRAVAGNAM